MIFFIIRVCMKLHKLPYYQQKLKKNNKPIKMHHLNQNGCICPNSGPALGVMEADKSVI